MYLPETYLDGLLKRLAAAPITYDQEADPPPMTAVDHLRDGLLELKRRGLVEIDYNTDKTRDGFVAKLKGHDKPAPASHLHYEETPALLALRERRRTLGR